MATLSVNIVSADRQVWSGEATQIVAKTVEGEIGILAGHEPLLAVLGDGAVRITTTDGSVVVVNAEGGFFSVNRNSVEVVAGQASLVA
ncbi:F0F1 ATP synthase subunit epsilon [Leucobacter chinensis]|uniref:F0F1 ATP synthase subunit epsilon n=1 Tax=Leucobacter chinensis TaxID=2851010 RepID=UPI001C214B8A|nr:F0F1 ATP synthase subunit epsilon [Leucobacter chinensis]